MLQNPVYERRLFGPSIRMYDETGRFVHHQHIVIFIQNRGAHGHTHSSPLKRFRTRSTSAYSASAPSVSFKKAARSASLGNSSPAFLRFFKIPESITSRSARGPYPSAGSSCLRLSSTPESRSIISSSRPPFQTSLVTTASPFFSVPLEISSGNTLGSARIFFAAKGLPKKVGLS